MTIQQFKYIVALDEERHFSRAAEKCTVSQPGLTTQLKNIEEEIGIKIFDRTKSPLIPTAQGEEIIRRAKKILKEVEEIRTFVITEKNMLKGEIKLGVISTLSPYLVPLIIEAMNEALPEIYFTVREGSTFHLLQDLETGAIDIALMATPVGNANMREYPVFSEPFVAYLNDQHSMVNENFYKMQQADATNLLLLQNEFCYNSQLLEICNPKKARKLRDHFSYDISSVETLKNLARAGLGFAVVPALSVLNEKDSKHVKHFTDPKPVREISLVVSDTFTRKLLLEKMSAVIWKSLPEELKEDREYRKIRWNDSPYFAAQVEGLK